MGSGEENATPAKAAKAAAAPPPSMTASSETPSTPMYPEWGASVQAYYSAGAPGTPQAFFPPGVASSPSPHPYVWGGQHLIPAYGTPIPFSPMYHYPHPSMAAGVVYPQPMETEGKEQGSTKKTPKGGAGNAGGDAGPAKSGDGAKVNSGSLDEDATQSEYEGSSDGRDESSDQQEFSMARKNSGRSSREESSYSGRSQPPSKLPVSAPGRTVSPNPATNLNIGMDLWNAPHADAAVVKGRSSAVIAPVLAGRKGAMPEQWVQDERELKRQKRKQSNRESARRSRLRKQQECEELAKKVDELSSENSALRSELEQLNKDCKELESENASIVEELTRIYGEGVVSTLKSVNSDS